MAPPPWFDAARGVLNASVFAAPAVYRDELASVFRRNWQFLGPARWLTAPSAFFTTALGNTPVIVWRDAAGMPRAFVNRCLGGDRWLTEEQRGGAAQLTCACHGWRYAPDPPQGVAALEAVPKLEAWGDLLFGNLDPDAPPLADAVGEFGPYLEAILATLPGGVEIAAEAPLITRLACNWKLAAEAYGGDVLRDAVAGRASREALGDADATALNGFQASTAAGTAVVVEDATARGAGLLAGLRPLMGTLFPNLSYDGRGHALHVWRPVGPETTEAWTYALAGAGEPEQMRGLRLRACSLRFGPAGLETGDLEPVWAAATRAARGPSAQRRHLNLQMGLGRERRSNLPGLIADLVSEANPRRFYAWWQDELAHVAGAPARRRMLRVVASRAGTPAPVREAAS